MTLLMSPICLPSLLLGVRADFYLLDYPVVKHPAACQYAIATADIGIVNISSGEPISVGQLVQGWIKQNAWDIQPNFGHYPYPDYEPMEFWGDCKKLRGFTSSMHSMPRG